MIGSREEVARWRMRWAGVEARLRQERCERAVPDASSSLEAGLDLIALLETVHGWPIDAGAARERRGTRGATVLGDVDRALEVLTRKGEGSIARALRDLAYALDDLGSPAMVIGGIAAIARGVRRTTLDIDAVIWGPDVRLAEAVSRLKRQWGRQDHDHA